MARRLHGQAWRHALILFRDGALGDVSDEQLVEQFVNGQGEAGEGAFEVLLERHGPMVFRICRTILRDRHDAEDAFQATFLVLARRACSIRHPRVPRQLAARRCPPGCLPRPLGGVPAPAA